MSSGGTRKIDWEPVKHLVYDLYCVKKVTLDRLPEIMERDFGFQARHVPPP